MHLSKENPMLLILGDCFSVIDGPKSIPAHYKASGSTFAGSSEIGERSRNDSHRFISSQDVGGRISSSRGLLAVHCISFPFSGRSSRRLNVIIIDILPDSNICSSSRRNCGLWAGISRNYRFSGRRTRLNKYGINSHPL